MMTDERKKKTLSAGVVHVYRYKTRGSFSIKKGGQKGLCGGKASTYTLGALERVTGKGDIL